MVNNSESGTWSWLSSSFDQCEEFLSGLLLSPEASQHTRRHSDRARFLYSTHSHTHVTRGTGKMSAGTSGDVDTHVASITTATPRGLIAS